MSPRTPKATVQAETPVEIVPTGPMRLDAPAPGLDLIRGGEALIRIENESMGKIALLRPRDETRVLDAALAELRAYPSVARKAWYSIPYKKRGEDGSVVTVLVEGPSIKAALALARRALAQHDQVVDGRFCIQSALFCDFQYPDFFNWAAQGYKGITGEGEPKFFNAVTGKNLSFAEGIELGRKIWNLDNAIWTLQGRHRNDVKFADYIYDIPNEVKFTMPVNNNGPWEYAPVGGRQVDRQQFEEFKTRYYELESGDPETAGPKGVHWKTLDWEMLPMSLKVKESWGKNRHG